MIQFNLYLVWIYSISTPYSGLGKTAWFILTLTDKINIVIKSTIEFIALD